MEKEKKQNAVPADLSPYLHPVAVWEMKHIRKLSHLAALTYLPHKVNRKSLRRRHELELVISSWDCAVPAFDRRTAEEVGAEGDGMAISVSEVNKIYRDNTKEEQAIALASSKESQAQVASTRQAVADVVAAKIAEAAMAASAAAAAAASPLASVAVAAASPIASVAVAAASPLASAAGSIYAGLASLPLPGLRGGDGASANDKDSAAEPSGRPVAGLRDNGHAAMEESRAVAAAQTVAVATAALSDAAAAAADATSTATNGAASGTAVPSANVAPPSPATTTAIAAAAVAVTATTSTTSTTALATQPSSSACPSEWFVCDDPTHHMRIFVIQGSDTIDHWRLNLTFDPVTFEDPSLGVTVHRGVYEAAKALYDKFLPLIYEHLDSSPFARITFTGHSIGGSMAVLLMLMYKCRGVLTTRNIATVYTFGAPSVFCENPRRPAQHPDEEIGNDPWEAGAAACTTGGPTRILSTLGLKEQAVRNVIMSKDIVPRAFACDYSLVAELLKSWGASFREHLSLSLDGRKHLYYFVGRMIVLQPDRWHRFVSNDADHPLLPPGPGLYYIAEPSDMLVPRPRGTGSTAAQPQALPPPRLTMDAAASAATSLTNSPSSGRSNGKTGARGKGNNVTQGQAPKSPQSQRSGVVPPSARAALMELMDCPHPLETLADPKAYLDTGTISRYHNPDNYCVAFGRMIYLRRKQELTAAGRPMELWTLAPGRASNFRHGDDGGMRKLQGAPWDSSDDYDALPNPILQPAESLYI